MWQREGIRKEEGGRGKGEETEWNHKICSTIISSSDCMYILCIHIHVLQCIIMLHMYVHIHAYTYMPYHTCACLDLTGLAALRAAADCSWREWAGEIRRGHSRQPTLRGLSA